jgi:phenylacetate-CoA ligase
LYWNEELETLPREQLQNLQLRRLQLTVERCFFNVPFYRQRMQKIGVNPEDIKSLEDLKRLPFTYKKDFRDNYPYGMFAVPLSEVVRIHSSSGTTGKPTVVGYTRGDITNWAEMMARSLTAASVTKDDVIHNAYGYGLFTGGLGVHYGAERIGASVIPISGGNTKRQIMILKDYGSTVLTCTPSYALYMAEVIKEMGINPGELKLRVGVFGAEPWSDEMRQRLEESLDIIALDIYGMSELTGPGVAVECLYKNGLHIWEDNFMVEVINPQTEEVLPPGEVGELVFTSLNKEALPLLRYRTGDLSAIIEEPCPCGRTHRKIRRIMGRTDDMLIIRGVNVFPSQIESVLLELGKTEPQYQLVVYREGALDALEVKVEVSPETFSDEIKKLEELRAEVEKAIETTLGISVKVTLVEPKSIPRSEGKAQRVVDLRKI